MFPERLRLAPPELDFCRALEKVTFPVPLPFLLALYPTAETVVVFVSSAFTGVDFQLHPATVPSKSCQSTVAVAPLAKGPPVGVTGT